MSAVQRFGVGCVVALSLCFGAAACETGMRPMETASTPVATPVCPEYSQPPPINVSTVAPYQMTSHTFTVRGHGQLTSDAEMRWGPLWKVTVTIGPWLPGSDRPALENAWQEMSGQDSGMPLVSGRYWRMIPSDRGKECLDSRRAVYLFGTVDFEDMTTYGDVLPERVGNPPPYPPPEEIGDLSLWVNPEAPEQEMIFACFDTQCGNTATGPSGGEPFAGIPFVSYRFAVDCVDLEAPGPRPFIVALPDVFSPDSSDGYPQLSEYVLQLESGGSVEPSINPNGTESAYIPTQTSWENP